MENLKARIHHIFEQKLGIDKHKLLPSTTLQELALDEIDLVMLTICLEDEFEIMIDDAAFSQISTLERLYQFIDQQCKLHAQLHTTANQ